MIETRKAVVIFALYWIPFLTVFSQCPEINASSLVSNFCVTNESNDLFISEYIEYENNKCLELFNGTGQSVNLYLEDYTLKVYENGAIVPSVVELDNIIIADKNTLTICDFASDSDYLDKSDLLDNLIFDGNDAVALYHNDELVDQIGVIGCDPGENWKVVSGQRTKKSKLVRIPTKTIGTIGNFNNCNFTPLSTEWSIYPTDANTLGSHESIISDDCCTLCPNQLFTVNVDDGNNLPQGGSIDWIFGAESDFNPYSEGTHFISSIIPSANCAPVAGDVRFNEIMVSPVNNDDDYNSPTTGEWIELLGPAGFDIGCFLISDGDWVVRIPPNTILDQDGLFVIGFDATTEKPIDLDLASCNCTFSNDLNNVLTLENSGEYILLFNGNTYSDAMRYGSPGINNTFPFGDLVAGGNIPTPNVTGCVNNNFNLLTPNWAYIQLVPSPGESYEREPDYSGNFIAEQGGSQGSCNEDIGVDDFPISATYGFLNDLCNEHVFIKGKINPTYGNCDLEEKSVTDGLEVCIACPKIDIHTTLMEGESIEVNGTIYDENNPKGIEKDLNVGDICDTSYDIDLSFQAAAECPEFTVYNATTGTSCSNNCQLCPNDDIQIQLEGLNLPQGSVDWYLGTNPNFDPYIDEGEFISSSEIRVNTAEVTPCDPCPEFIALMIDACNNSSIKEADNEFMIVSSGGGIPTAGQLQIDLASQNDNGAGNMDINIGANPCTFLNTPDVSLMNSLRASVNCNNVNVIAAGPNTPIPAASLVVIFMSSNVSINYNFDGLCANGETIYVLQNSCDRTIGAFTNSQGNGTRTYRVSIDGCDCNSSISYNVKDGTNIANLVNGTYAYKDINGVLRMKKSVPCAAPPVHTIPIPSIPSTIDPFFYFVPYELCDESGPQEYYIKGIINPLFDGCDEVTTQTFTFTVDCTEPELETATLCVGEGLYNLKGIEDPSYTGGWSSEDTPITDVSGDQFFDPTTIGTYTFKFSPISNCGDTAITTIEVTAGSPIELLDSTICASANVINLEDIINESPIPDGTWSGSQVDDVNTTFDPSGLQGDIEITFTPEGTTGCSTAATAIFTMAVPDTAIFTTHSMCENESILDLTLLFDGASLLTDGTFQGTNVSEIDGTFDPSGLDGDYTISFAPTGDCVASNSFIISVTQNKAPDVKDVTLCNSESPLDLNTIADPSYLTGTWTLNGTQILTFDPSIQSAGTYELVFESDEDCLIPASAMITVTDEITVTILSNFFCTDETDPIDLELLNDPDYRSGIWSGDHVIDGEFSGIGLTAGSYPISFQSDQACVKESNTTIEVIEAVTPNLGAILPICEGAEFIDLTNYDDIFYTLGSWSGTNVLNDVFNSDELAAGTYILTFTSTEACIRESSTDLVIQSVIEPSLITPSQICQTAMPLNLSTLLDINYPNGSWGGDGVMGNEFDPNGLTVGQYELTFESSEECSEIVSVMIEVVDLVSPTLFSPSDICNSANPLDLSTLVDVNYPNGTWSGDGVSGTQFDPNALTVGQHELTFESSEDCTKTVSIMIEVVDLISPVLISPSDICIAESPLDLSTLIDINYPNGTWSGVGVSDSQFDPTGLAVGQHELIFESSDDCTETVSVMIEVIDLVSPILLLPSDICNSAGPLDLATLVDINYPSGIWSGDGVSGIQFDPSGLAVGQHELIFESSDDCTEKVSVMIEVVDLVIPLLISPSNMCNSATPLDLSTLVDINYPNGIWSGDGVSGIQFDPNGLAIGQHELIFESSNDCTEKVSVMIEVIDLVTPELIDPAEICNGASILDLFTLLDPNYLNGTWSGDGISGNSFNPDGLSLGEHELTFESSEECTETVSVMITVVDLVEPKLIQPDEICKTAIPLDLTTLLDVDFPTGTWTGNGVVDTEFDPNGLAIGPHILTFASDNICAKPIGIAINIIGEETPKLGKPSSLCQTDTPLNLMDFVDPNFPTGEWSGKGVNNNIFFPIDLPQGSYDIAFVPDANCVTDASLQIDVMVATTSLYEESICSGTSIELFGVTFDESHSSEDIILPVLNQFGCDSIVSVQVLFKNTLTATLSGGDEVCAGDIAQILVEFSDNGIHDITIFDGHNNFIYNDIVSGTPIDVLTTENTTYNITAVEVDGCELDIKGTAQVLINDISVDIETVSNFNGYQISCDGEADGHVSASTNGTGHEPYYFIWSDNTTEPSLSDLYAGEYHVTVIDSRGCKSENSIVLEAPEKFQSDLYIEQPNCEVRTGNIEIGVENPLNGPYVVSVGAHKVVLNGEKAVISNLPAGHHELQIEDQNGCVTYESIEIDTIRLPYFNLGEDITILQGESIDLTTYIDFNTSKISWYPPDFLSCDNCLETVATPTNTMAYQLKLTDSNGCFYIDAITVFVKIEDRLYIPNGFTPNFDATNDVFKVHTDRNDLIIEEMAILDRWGEVVYSAKDKKPEDAVWDGSFNGKGAMQGVYGYYIVVKFPNGKTKLFEGDITLMR